MTLQVRPGELVAVTGPSGSGKSSLLAVAGGLDRASTGAVQVGGVELGGLSPRLPAAPRRRPIGYVFQDFDLIAGLTATESRRGQAGSGGCSRPPRRA